MTVWQNLTMRTKSLKRTRSIGVCCGITIVLTIAAAHPSPAGSIGHAHSMGFAKYQAPCSLPVSKFTEQGPTLEIVRRLAIKYRVVIGTYGTKPSGGDNIGIGISVNCGTVADVLDAITKADSRFQWYDTGMHSIHFVPHGPRFTLMDVPVQRFDLRDVGKTMDTLQETPSVREWYRKRKCPLGMSIINSGGAPKRWIPVKVHLTNVKVANVLDEVARQSHSYYWSYFQQATQGCGMVLGL